LPFRIEDVQMSKTMEYFISSQHWLDALTHSTGEAPHYLADTAALLLSRSASAPVGISVNLNGCFGVI